MQSRSWMLLASAVTVSMGCMRLHGSVTASEQASSVVDARPGAAGPRTSAAPLLVQPQLVQRQVAPKGSPQLAKLIQKNDLVYQGAFRLGDKFSYGGGVLTFDPMRNVLLVMGFDGAQQVAEIEVPTILNGQPADLATASMTQPLADILEGKRNTIDGDTANGTVIGGLWPFSDPRRPTQQRLAVTVYSYYDANGAQTLSHFVRPRDFNDVGHVTGPFKTSAPKAGYVAGYFAQIPQAWQAALGGPVLNGLCCTSIISRTSSGPSAWIINPADIGTVKTVPVAPLVYYPFSNPLGAYGTSNPYFNGTGGVSGAVFPEGTRSVLFIGTHGTGPYCYGPGTPDASKAGKPATDVGDTNDRWCFDPTSPYKSPHGYPYVYRVWAYDANDLASVKAGSRSPWDPKPYAYWDLDLPTAARKAVVTGVGYDSGTGRIFVGQGFADGDAPVIHVFAIR